MTIPYDPAELAERTRRTATLLLAAGLDPERCTLFVQSHVRAHTELTWILNCVATFGELRRMTQFKEKSAGPGVGERRALRLPGADGRRHPRLRHRRVPVGDDQRQHLELARDIARAVQPPLRRDARRPEGGDPAGRRAGHGPAGPDGEDVEVGRLPQGTIALLDDPAAITKRLQAAR